MNKEIEGLLQQGYSLLTPTMRLSRHLLNQYAALQIEQCKRSWESADILPWQAWLIRFWEDYSASKAEEVLLLNSWQQQNVWLQVVQDSDYLYNNLLNYKYEDLMGRLPSYHHW